MAKRSIRMLFMCEVSSDESETSEITRKEKKYKKRTDYYEEYDEEDFIKRFRLSKKSFDFVMGRIKSEIKATTNRNMVFHPQQKLMLALRFYATGSILLTVSDFTGVSVATASQVVKEVSIAIAKLGKEFIKMPDNENERRKTKSTFHDIAKFPKVIGCIDGTHVRIQSPGGENAIVFRNRKGYFSLNVQAVCNANLEITDLVSRWPGSAHDSNIFANSRLKMRFENGEFEDCFLLGDSDYAVSSYMMTPLSNPQREEEALYNESQIRTRNTIERCFRVWKRRFPVLSLGIRVNLDTTMAIIVACGVLHNIARIHKDINPPIEDSNMTVEEESQAETFSVEEINETARNRSVRSSLIKEYFARL